MLIFDVGANVGNRTAQFLAEGADRVIAVEPVRACFEVLTKRFVDDTRVVPLNKAVGAEPALAKIFLCSPNDDPLCACSSMNRAWIDAVIKAERFWPNNPEYYSYVEKLWQKEEPVEVVTLDWLIGLTGKPDYIKIDVEGSELEVLRGLSQSVPRLSFEFVPEVLDIAFACIDRCAQLGMTKFAVALQEQTQPNPVWMFAGTVKQLLEQFRGDKVMYGDVYAVS